VETWVRIVFSILVTFLGLPQELQLNPFAWNPMTHGNISIVIVLLAGRYVRRTTFGHRLITLFRLAWFMGIGRKRHYYGQTTASKAQKAM
jgi:hypothetical protein